MKLKTNKPKPETKNDTKWEKLELKKRLILQGLLNCAPNVKYRVLMLVNGILNENKDEKIKNRNEKRYKMGKLVRVEKSV